MIPPVCRHIDAVLNDHFRVLINTLRTKHACSDEAIEAFTACMYRQGSIIKYGHSVLRLNDQDENLDQVTNVLMRGIDDSHRPNVFGLVRSFMDTVCEYTDSYNY